MVAQINLANKFRAISEEINASRETELVKVAAETAALARLRIQNEKVDANGNSFGQYSQALVPRWYLYNRSNSSGADQRVRKGSWFQSYRDLREANGLPTDNIDFTFSGEMLRNTGVTEIINNGNSTTVAIGGQTTQAKRKLGYQLDRFGNILALNEQERGFVIESYQERINNIINNFF